MKRLIWSKCAVYHGLQLKRSCAISLWTYTFRTVWKVFISLRTIKIISVWPTFNCRHERIMNAHKVSITNYWAIDMLKVIWPFLCVYAHFWNYFFIVIHNVFGMNFWKSKHRNRAYTHRFHSIRKKTLGMFMIFVPIFLPIVCKIRNTYFVYTMAFFCRKREKY